MSITKLKRNLLPYLLDLRQQFPVVAIIGARQVGKTSLAKTSSEGWLYVDLEKPSIYERIMADPEFFLKQNSEHVIFDEAQLMPELFEVLRGVIDENRQQKNRFILTGSSSPDLMKNISESLAGRVATIELGTLKTNEYYAKPISPFYKLFQQKLDRDNVNIIDPIFSFEEIQKSWYLGGYPEPLTHGNIDFYREWMVDYQAAYINQDISRLFPGLNKIAYNRFITILANLSSRIINKSDLARSVEVSQPTITDYLQIADGTFIWRSIPSYAGNIMKQLVKMPRGHIRDSGLLHHMLHINSIEDLYKHPIAGFSFEAYIIEEIIKGVQAARVRNVEYFYYRTRSGAEIDLILKGPFGILPIEIKLGRKVNMKQLTTLENFVKDEGLPFGVVVNMSDRMEWLTPYILQVPAGCL